jgi:hypothetical protein
MQYTLTGLFYYEPKTWFSFGPLEAQTLCKWQLRRRKRSVIQYAKTKSVTNVQREFCYRKDLAQRKPIYVWCKHFETKRGTCMKNSLVALGYRRDAVKRLGGTEICTELNLLCESLGSNWVPVKCVRNLERLSIILYVSYERYTDTFIFLVIFYLILYYSVYLVSK